MAVFGDPNVFYSSSNVKSANIFDMVVKGFKCLKLDLIVILHHSYKISLQSDRSLVWLPNYACFKYLEQVYIRDVSNFCYLSWEKVKKPYRFRFELFQPIRDRDLILPSV